MSMISELFHVDLSLLSDLSPVTTELWEREVDYWTYLMTGDLQAYVQLLHSRLACWPSACERPCGIEPVREIGRHYIWMLSSRPSLTLRPHLITEGEAPSTFLTFKVEGRGPDGAPLDEFGRILHVWAREGGAWRIIAGASSVRQLVERVP